ncbi:MAG: hypothetical protein QX189_06740 [Methylococcales bacterium]
MGWRDNQLDKICDYIGFIIGIAYVIPAYEIGKIAVYFPHVPEHSHLTDAYNIKRSDLTDVDNGNKRTLSDD